MTSFTRNFNDRCSLGALSWLLGYPEVRRRLGNLTAAGAMIDDRMIDDIRTACENLSRRIRINVSSSERLFFSAVLRRAKALENPIGIKKFLSECGVQKISPRQALLVVRAIRTAALIAFYTRLKLMFLSGDDGKEAQLIQALTMVLWSEEMDFDHLLNANVVELPQGIDNEILSLAQQATRVELALAWSNSNKRAIVASLGLLCVLSILAGLLAQDALIGKSHALVLALSILALPTLASYSIIFILALFSFSAAPAEKKYDRRFLASEAPKRTVFIVVPLIISKKTNVDELVRLNLSNVKSSTCVAGVCLLVDFEDSNSDIASASELELLNELNLKISGTFGAESEKLWAVLYRERDYCPVGNVYRGWERKRGKILDFCKHVVSDSSSRFSVAAGNIRDFHAIEYIAVLDEDSVATLGALDELYLCAKFHYDIGSLNLKFCPVSLSSGSGALAKIFSLMAPLSGANFWQSVFGQVPDTGKGLFRPRDFLSCGVERVRDNTILSHDIIEGFLLRSTQCRSSVIVEAEPPSWSAYFVRMDRWNRGDLQNLIYGYKFAKNSFSVFFLAINALRKVVTLTKPLILLCLALLGAWSAFFFVFLASPLIEFAVFSVARFSPSPAYVKGLWAVLRDSIGAELISFVMASCLIGVLLHSIFAVACSVVSGKGLLDWSASRGAGRQFAGWLNRVWALALFWPLLLSLTFAMQSFHFDVVGMLIPLLWSSGAIVIRLFPGAER